jgi:ABC-2 type transport system permease protein
LRSELIKLAGTKGPVMFAGLAFGLMVLAAIVRLSLGQPAGGALIGDARIAALVMLVHGADDVAAEFRHGTITSTALVAQPRWHIILAKGLAHAAAGFIVGVLLALFAALIATLGTPGGTGLSAVHTVRMVAGIGVLTALFAALGVGLGAIVRNQLAAVAAALLYVFVIERTLAGGSPGWARFGLTGAATSLALDGNPISAGVHALPQLLGSIIVLGWATASLTIAALILRYRDIP